jgi:hypothetical protein
MMTVPFSLVFSIIIRLHGDQLSCPPAFIFRLNKPGSVLEHIVQLEFASLARQNGRQIGNVAGVFRRDRLRAQ